MAMKPVSVSQVNGYIKRVLQSDPLLGSVAVIGEIANLNFHSSGHIYFSLKDEASKIACFLPASAAARLRYQLAEGLEVTVYGAVGVFERGGSYSITVRDVEVQGAGNLAAAFEALKAKLDKEGLFDAAHKKPIPTFPHRVALVTSPTGAAVHDMIKVIRQHNHLVDLLVYPVLVQGPGAAPEIAAAVRDVNARFSDVDVLIVGRGGGSQEELWAFNEEIVARAVYESAIPVISAVGHEIDFSICDFAADRRAATPTEAADLAVPDVPSLLAQIEHDREKLQGAGFMEYVKLLRYRIETGKERLQSGWRFASQKAEQRTDAAHTALEALSPFAILERGYSIVLNESGKPVNSINSVETGAPLTVLLKDGTLGVTVTSREGKEK